MNQVVLVGRIFEKPIIKELEDGKKVSYITLKVPRSFKNTEGIYEDDFIRCVLWNNIALNTCEYCHKGDVVGVKGRLQMNEGKLNVIAEKVTFLSYKKENECCSQCGEEITEENQGESELALKDNICRDCMEDGYGK